MGLGISVKNNKNAAALMADCLRFYNGAKVWNCNEMQERMAMIL